MWCATALPTDWWVHPGKSSRARHRQPGVFCCLLPTRPKWAVGCRVETQTVDLRADRFHGGKSFAADLVGSPAEDVELT